MRVKHKAPWYEAVRSTIWGLLWTKRGLQVVRPGDYIVKAPSGCTWRLRAKDVQSYYHIEKNLSNGSQMALETSLDNAVGRIVELENWIQKGTEGKAIKAGYSVFQPPQYCGNRHAPGFCLDDDPQVGRRCNDEAAHNVGV